MNLPVNYNNISPYKRKQVREQYVIIQKGKCSHCKEPLSKKPSNDIMSKWIDKSLFPNGFFKYPIHLHHDHITGMTIGAIHSICNAVLWQYHGE